MEREKEHSGKRFDLASTLVDVLLRAERKKRLGQEHS